MKMPVVSNTPWELYYAGDVGVMVKREDLSCPSPGPSFSKIRGVQKHLEALIEQRGRVPIGVLDTVHSKAGWGVAYLCNWLGMPCYNFFPAYKGEWVLDGFIPRENQIQAHSFGASLIPMTAGRSAILYHKAKKALLEYTRDGYIINPPHRGPACGMPSATPPVWLLQSWHDRPAHCGWLGC